MVCLCGEGSCHLGEVFSVQKKVVRIIAGAGCRDHCRPLFQRYRILTLPCCYVLECLMYARDNRGQRGRRDQVHQYETRHRDEFTLPQFRLNRAASSYLYLAYKMYNVLPLDFKNEQLSRSAFKSKVKNMLVEGTFYNTSEYFGYCEERRGG